MKIITMGLGLADNGAINSFSFHSNSVCRTKSGAVVITIYSGCGARSSDTKYANNRAGGFINYFNNRQG